MKSVPGFLLILLISHVAIENHASENVLRIPLTRIGPQVKNHHSRVARLAVPLDFSRISHIGNISIGTNPPQIINVIFDTGSSQLWALSSFYDSSDPNSGTVLMKHHLYNHSASPTFVSKADPKPDRIEYATGWVLGFRATDTISIADNEISHDFLEVTKVAKQQSEAAYDGVMGLKYHPIHGNIISQICKAIKSDYKFSFYFPRNDSLGNDLQGELTLCGENTSKYVDGTMKSIDTIEPGYWHVTIERADLAFDSEAGSFEIDTKATATIDTGSNRIGVPQAQIDYLYQLLNAQPIKNSNAKQVDCKLTANLPKLIINMNGNNFTLTHQDYIREDALLDGKRCRLLFHKMASHWNLGDPFLRRYYSVFDMKNHKIGLAESKQ